MITAQKPQSDDKISKDMPHSTFIRTNKMQHTECTKLSLGKHFSVCSHRTKNHVINLTIKLTEINYEKTYFKKLRQKDNMKISYKQLIEAQSSSKRPSGGLFGNLSTNTRV